MMDSMALNRREFLRSAAVAPVAAKHLWSHPHEKAKRRLLFVGTRTDKTSKGIYAYRWDPEQGELTSLGLAVESQEPTFLTVHPNGEFLYAANELDEFEGAKSGAVSAFRIDREQARLHPINQIASEGTETCNVNVSHTGYAAFCANYASGSMSSFFLNPSGALSAPVSHFQYHGHGPNPERQAGPHAHRVTPSPDDRFLLVNDLGLDRIHIYRLDAANAKLTPNDPPHWEAFAGSGPRALHFHPNGHVAYVVFEMGSAVQALHWDKEKGTLHALQDPIHLTPPTYHEISTGCDMVLDHKARFAYVINRFYNRIITFSVDHDGKLTLLHRSSCGGEVPRHLALDPTGRWLLLANQKSDNIAVFEIHPETGVVSDKPAKSYPISIPQCLLFV
ncbi:MAG TPA: lactonase family protein [Acidobacterium sp.]|nr:lactonase family protein [Acidobacterium sp.]